VIDNIEDARLRPQEYVQRNQANAARTLEEEKKKAGFVGEITSVFIESHVVKLGGREAAVQRETPGGLRAFALGTAGASRLVSEKRRQTRHRIRVQSSSFRASALSVSVAGHRRKVILIGRFS
jgi:hypothetical protein